MYLDAAYESNNNLVILATDSAAGQSGNDTLILGDRDDTLFAYGGADSIIASEGGSDYIVAGTGDDTIVMGTQLTNFDLIQGGDGVDVLTFTDASSVDGGEFSQVYDIERIVIGSGNTKFALTDSVFSANGVGLDATIDASAATSAEIDAGSESSSDSRLRTAASPTTSGRVANVCPSLIAAGPSSRKAPA